MAAFTYLETHMSFLTRGDVPSSLGDLYNRDVVVVALIHNSLMG